MGSCPVDVAIDGNDLWVINKIQTGAPLCRVHPETGAVQYLQGAGKFNTAIAIINGDIWVTSALEDKLYRIGRSDGKPLQEYPTGHFPYRLASNGKYVWTSICLATR